MSVASVRNYEAGALPSARALEKLRVIAPFDFESLFAKGSESSRLAANERWHRMLESILKSGRDDVVTAVKNNLILFNRIATADAKEQSRATTALRSGHDTKVKRKRKRT